MSEASNPYAPPAARVDDAAVDSEAEAVRKAHISHEASIKAVGILYYLGGALVTLGGVASLFSSQSRESGAGLFAFMLALGVLQLAGGYAVRTLRRWGQVLGSVLSALGLFAFPIGTLINGYILYLFLSKKGRTIFSPQYQEVIAATPHVKYRTSIVVWIFLAIVVGLLVVGVLAAMMGK